MTKKITSLLLSLCLTFTGCINVAFAAVAQKGFYDCHGHWAEHEIYMLLENGIVKGNGGIFFYPDNKITRSEFLAMMSRAVNLKEIPYGNTFGDVTADLWYSGILQAAYEAEMINPALIADGSFHGDMPILREEMASVLASGYRYFTGLEIEVKDINHFSDLHMVDDSYLSDVKKSVQTGLMAGVTLNEFQPKGAVTRAQAVTAIFRLLNHTPDNILPDGDFHKQDTDWKFQIRNGAAPNGGYNPQAVGDVIFSDGYNEPGCIRLDVQNSGYKCLDALRWNYNFKTDTEGYTIEKGKTYILTFYAKLEGINSFDIKKLRLQDWDNNDLRYTPDTPITISGDEWKYYQMIMNPSDNASNVRLQFQAGGDAVQNFILYMDDFCLKEASSNKKILVSATVDEAFGEITDVSGGGTYDEGEMVTLSAGVKPGYDYLFDTWIDSYENSANQNSVMTVTSQGASNYYAKFKPYKVKGNSYIINTVSEKPQAIVQSAVAKGDTATIEGAVSLPKEYTLSECGVVVVEGAYCEKLNVFTEGAEILKPEAVSEDGQFAVSLNGINEDTKLLLRAYAIYKDTNGIMHIVYSDKSSVLPQNTAEKKEYKLIYNHELLILFDGPFKNITQGYEHHESFIKEIENTDVDAVTVCPQLWRTYAWDSEVDTSHRQPIHPDVKSVYGAHEAARNYILSGGDPVGNTLSACREYGKDFIASFRMNDYHYTNDKTWSTHNLFWREHPEYWLYDSDSDYWQRLHNYMIPEVREFYFDIIEEFVNKYDIDGLELDFMRSMMYFYPEEAVEQGTPVMTDFVGRVRDLLDRAGNERGKYIPLIVKLPETVSKAVNNGFDAAEMDRLGYIDAVHLSFGDFASTEIEVEQYKNILKNSQLFAEITWITYQRMPARKYTTVETYNAIAYNLLSRGVDTLTVFNTGYFGDPYKKHIINSLQGIAETEALKKRQKQYIMGRNLGTFPAKTEKEYTLIIPDDTSSGIFSSALFRVEMEKDCTSETIDVYINDVKLTETERDDPELFQISKPNDTGYPNIKQVKFYNVPLSVLKPGENKFFVKVVSDDTSGQIFSTELALYH